MTRDDIKRATRIIQAIECWQKTSEEISERFAMLDKDSTEEEIRDFFTFLITSGHREALFDAIWAIKDSIDKRIEELEKELKEL